jgi:hypothetical protein
VSLTLSRESGWEVLTNHLGSINHFVFSLPVFDQSLSTYCRRSMVICECLHQQALGWSAPQYRAPATQPVICDNENITLKCFNPIPIEPYINYMSQILQPRRIQGWHNHRDTNKPRNKTKECIWNRSESFKDEVRDIMMRISPYNQFCNKCMESKDDLLYSWDLICMFVTQCHATILPNKIDTWLIVILAYVFVTHFEGDLVEVGG